MKQISHEELRFVLHSAFAAKVTAFIWGATGIGKSYAVREVAKEIAKEKGLKFSDTPARGTKEEFKLIDIRLAQMDPCELKGLPKIDGDSCSFTIPSWLPKDGQGIILLDEINLSPPLVQSAAYQLVRDRRLGDYTVPAGYGIIAAGNRSQDKAYCFELAGPLCNRFIHIELGAPNISDWTDWATSVGVDHRIITYLNYAPKHLHLFDTKLDDKAFPTHRSWAEYCSPLIKDKKLSTTQLHTLVASAVGEGVATECCAFLRLMDKIDLDDLIEHPEKVKSITAVDMKFSLIGALVERITKHIKDKDQEIIKKLCEVAQNMEMEFLILLFRFLRKSIMATPEGFTKLAKQPGFKKALSSAYPFLKLPGEVD